MRWAIALWRRRDISGRYAKSIAWLLSSASEQKSSAPSCVARNTTRGALPASNASFHRGAHRHQRSPVFNPGKPNFGNGVDKSFPRALEKRKNSSVATMHTVWLPPSSGPVSQHPLRKKPVMGFVEHACKGSPNTFRDGAEPPPNPFGSKDIFLFASPSSLYGLGASCAAVSAFDGKVGDSPLSRNLCARAPGATSAV